MEEKKKPLFTINAMDQAEFNERRKKYFDANFDFRHGDYSMGAKASSLILQLYFILPAQRHRQYHPAEALAFINKIDAFNLHYKSNSQEVTEELVRELDNIYIDLLDILTLVGHRN